VIERNTPVLVNDQELTEQMASTLIRVAGAERVAIGQPTTTAEDFAFFANEVPALFFRLGVNPQGSDPATAAPNHSPFFFTDEGALIVGVRAMAHLVADYMYQQQ
jgi:amidohydrolase